MKKTIFILLLFSICVNAQIENLEQKLDSIITEADILYRHEKAAWHATDILLKKKELMDNYGGYAIYFKDEKTHIVYRNKNNNKSLAHFTFTNSELIKPEKSNYAENELTKEEITLFDIKDIISKQLSNPEYNIRIPNNCNPNLILIQGKDNYKLYIIMGPKINGIIPFGNDYLFKTDSNGKITEWKKFHKSFIPLATKSKDGGEIESTIHSHLKMTPLITATDICSFKLYNQNMNNFIVSSTSLNKILKYDLTTNSISIIDPKKH